MSTQGEEPEESQGDKPQNETTPPPPILSYRSAQSGPEAWVTVHKARTPAEAELAALALQDKGLRARVDFDNTATIGAWAGAGPGTETRVQVLAGDVEAARAYLDAIEQRRHRRLEAQTLKCPSCGKADPKRIFPPARWVGLGLIVLGLALTWLNAMFCVPVSAIGIFMFTWPMVPAWRCRACGFKWRAKDPKQEFVDDEEDDDNGEAKEEDDGGDEGDEPENDVAPVDRNGGDEQREH